MRVLVVAEPSLFEESIEELLRQQPGVEIVGPEADPQDATRLIKESHPDVILVADGEAATGMAPQLMRMVREGFPMRMVEVHLATNTLCIYRGDRRSVREAGDLVDTVRHLCDGLSREPQVPLGPVMGEAAV
jgi:chemotaxis response regulator CheB